MKLSPLKKAGATTQNAPQIVALKKFRALAFTCKGAFFDQIIMSRIYYERRRIGGCFIIFVYMIN